MIPLRSSESLPSELLRGYEQGHCREYTCIVILTGKGLLLFQEKHPHTHLELPLPKSPRSTLYGLLVLWILGHMDLGRSSKLLSQS